MSVPPISTAKAGPQGEPGADGADGADGASAYAIAVAAGFVGDEAAWLASLVGDTGPQGPQGDPGADGADGAGVATGGTTGQVLAKASGTDYDTEWITPFSGSYNDLADKPAVAKVYEKVALSPNGAAIAAGTGKGFVPITVAGTITAVRIDLDPANEPTDQATLVDVNKVDRSTGTATSILTAAMSIATSANSATGTINGTQTVAAGDWLQVDIDQGSDGQDLICSIEITPN